MDGNDTDLMVQETDQSERSILDRILCRGPMSEEDAELASKGRTLDTFFGVIVRVIHASYELLTPFDLRAHIFRVDVGFAI